MKTFMFAQYSPEWVAIRSGIPTASQFGRIMTPAQRKYSSQARAYALELQGYTYREIGTIYGKSEPWAHQRVMAMRDALTGGGSL